MQTFNKKILTRIGKKLLNSKQTIAVAGKSFRDYLSTPIGKTITFYFYILSKTQ